MFSQSIKKLFIKKKYFTQQIKMIQKIQIYKDIKYERKKLSCYKLKLKNLKKICKKLLKIIILMILAICTDTKN